jgi:hypothetical protein
MNSTNTLRLWATYELLSSRRAIVSFRTTDGKWAGAGRVDIKVSDRDALREECYRIASQQAACKGLILDRFSEGVA